MAVFTDDFDRANAASLGVNWTEVGVNAFRISTNRSLGLTNKINFTHPAALSPVAGMYVQVEIYDVGAVAHGIGCMLSAPAPSRLNGYGLKFMDDSFANMSLMKYIDWTHDYTSGTRLGIAVPSPVRGDIVRLECIAGVSQKVYINGVLKISAADAVYTTGVPGLICSTAGGAFSKWNDFEAGDWPIPATGGAGSPFALGMEPGWNRNLGHP